MTDFIERSLHRVSAQFAGHVPMPGDKLTATRELRAIWRACAGYRLGVSLAIVTIAVVLAVGAWWSFPSQATQQFNSISMDPVGMMSTTTNLPTDPERDHGTVFPPAGVHYN